MSQPLLTMHPINRTNQKINTKSKETVIITPHPHPNNNSNKQKTTRSKYRAKEKKKENHNTALLELINTLYIRQSRHNKCRYSLPPCMPNGYKQTFSSVYGCNSKRAHPAIGNLSAYFIERIIKQHIMLTINMSSPSFNQ